MMPTGWIDRERELEIPLGLYLGYFQKQFLFSFPRTVTEGPTLTCDLVSSGGNGVLDSAQIFLSQGFRLVKRGDNSLYFEYMAFAGDNEDECVDLFCLDGYIKREGGDSSPESIDEKGLKRNRRLMASLFNPSLERMGVYIETKRGRRYGVWYEFRGGKLREVGYEDNDFFYDEETGTVEGNGALVVERDEWPEISFPYKYCSTGKRVGPWGDTMNMALVDIVHRTLPIIARRIKE